LSPLVEGDYPLALRTGEARASEQKPGNVDRSFSSNLTVAIEYRLA